VDELLTGRENLELVGLLYHLSRREYKRRAVGALERFGLTAGSDRRTAPGMASQVSSVRSIGLRSLLCTLSSGATAEPDVRTARAAVRLSSRTVAAGPPLLREPGLTEPVALTGHEVERGHVVEDQAGRAEPRMPGAGGGQLLPP
jgi:hypothetical protein